MFAFGWPEEDSAYVNIGTSAFVQRALTRDPGYVPRQLTGIILDDGKTTVYTVEGNVNGAGTALEWLRQEPGMEDLDALLPQWLAAPGEPPLFLNGIAGLGGPFWKPDFASRFVGAGEPWQKAVAVVESIAFLLQANIDEMAKYVPPAARIRVSGGVSQIDGLCRRLAALSGLPRAPARGRRSDRARHRLPRRRAAGVLEPGRRGAGFRAWRGCRNPRALPALARVDGRGDRSLSCARGASRAPRRIQVSFMMTMPNTFAAESARSDMFEMWR